MVDTISNIDSGSYSNASSDSFTITPSSTLSDNDCIVVCITANDFGGSRIIDSMPDGFVYVDNHRYNGSWHSVVLAKICGDSEPSSYTFNYTFVGIPHTSVVAWSVYSNVSSFAGLKAKREYGVSNKNLGSTVDVGQMMVMCWSGRDDLSGGSGDYTEDVFITDGSYTSAIVTRTSTGQHKTNDYSYSYTDGGDPSRMVTFGCVLTPTDWERPYVIHTESKDRTTEGQLKDNISFDVPDRIQDDDIIFVIISIKGNGVSAPTFTEPSGFSNDFLDNSNEHAVGVFSKVASGESGSYSFLWSLSETFSALLFVMRGVDTSNIYDVDVSGGSWGSRSSWTFPSISTPSGNSMVIRCNASYHDSVVTYDYEDDIYDQRLWTCLGIYPRINEDNTHYTPGNDSYILFKPSSGNVSDLSIDRGSSYPGLPLSFAVRSLNAGGGPVDSPDPPMNFQIDFSGSANIVIGDKVSGSIVTNFVQQ